MQPGPASIVVDHELVATLAGRRRATPLLVVDIAVPRNVDSAGRELPGVTLLDLDDLRDWAAQGHRAARRRGRVACATIVGEEVERFMHRGHRPPGRAARRAASHERAEAIRQAELERFAARLATLDPHQRAAVEAVTKGIVAKLLHQPSVRLKDDAGTPQGERNAAAVRDLFDLS